ncbi:MAG: hypothetical protein IM526_02290 [Microcystis sp. M38BS1]|uniref:hypothetical protein n=1 Tax=Microcystis sp. M38BS1 TaxID=2771188 RepID=UPI0031FCECD3|nr:hypothetical protein [Microcystis sp. M38BS1]MCA6582482.1 hypothetical protein [Pseudanabaena sp. M34BS1SP1A06MG]
MSTEVRDTLLRFSSKNLPLPKDDAYILSKNHAIIEKAYTIVDSHPNKRKITIPELKKTMPYGEISTKEIEEVLLEAGWEIFKSGTCPTKFFRPPLENN